jgi:hypothetical protein
MLTPDTKKQLLSLVDTPNLLEPAVRAKIQSFIDDLSDLQGQNLLNILAKGKQQLLDTDKKFDQEELPLKKRILDELAEFERHGVMDAVHQTEQDSEAAKQQNLKKISQQLDEIN